MSWEELVGELRKLSRVEKLRAMQILVRDLVEEEPLLTNDTEYAIYTPFGNEAAAQVLLDMLDKNERQQH